MIVRKFEIEQIYNQNKNPLIFFWGEKYRTYKYRVRNGALIFPICALPF
jgi:hypothetical protein